MFAKEIPITFKVISPSPHLVWRKRLCKRKKFQSHHHQLFPWCTYMKVVKPSGVDIEEVSPHTQLSSFSTLSLSLLVELRWIQYLSSKISAFTKTNDEWKVFPFHHHFHSWNFNFILSTPRLASSRAPFGCFTLRHNANIIPFSLSLAMATASRFLSPFRRWIQPRRNGSLSIIT